MSVTSEDLERLLDQLAAGVDDPRAGLFGPRSVTWRVTREWVVFLGAGRASLLQLAHPFVARAIEQHSDTLHDPLARFHRTFLHVYGMLFGTLDTALASARRVHRVHRGIEGALGERAGRFPEGHRYEANEPAALRWVFATLLDTSLLAYELGLGPLSAPDREGYHAEMRRFGALFGLPASLLPPTLPAFEAYLAGMLAGDELSVTAPARAIARFLLTPASAAVVPVMRWYTIMTAGMLPERLRAAYGLRFSSLDEHIYRSSLAVLRRAVPHLPSRLRHRPEYREALWRLEGAPRRDSLGRALERAITRSIRPRQSPSGA